MSLDDLADQLERQIGLATTSSIALIHRGVFTQPRPIAEPELLPSIGTAGVGKFCCLLSIEARPFKLVALHLQHFARGPKRHSL